ncbi:FERM and PDZ domain-containing protein 4-like protein, partial [Dinothrombium tinctorium]
HVNKTTTYENPRKDEDEPPPQPREVELFRHPELGFGFVAGSDKPVIVRFVKEGGPSENKLQAGDQILKINGEDVANARREHVIELVKSCKHSVVLTVCQPHTNNSTRKSALLTASKKAKLKSNPSRVRFAEGVVINGSPLYCPSPFESCVPFIPNVLKVFLENGQTKTFKYDSCTTIQDVLNSLTEKLSIKCHEHFSLCVEHIKSVRRNKLTLLDPKDTLQKIAARPGAHNLRCLFRVAFVPKDAFEMLTKDPISFEYLYVQCCNDMVQERFSPELKYEIALRLSALHLYQHAVSNGMLSSNGKVNLKAIEKECGLEHFVPYSLLDTMKRKELHKLLNHFLKQNQQLCPAGQKTLTALQAKIHYLKIISELPSYGAKMFPTNIRDSSIESALLISPKYGISHITSLRHSLPISLAKIEDVSSVSVTKDDELCYTVEIQLKGANSPPLHFGLEDKDAEEFTLVLQGYHRLFMSDENDYKPIPIFWDVGESWWTDSAPSYHGEHLVKVAPWSYLPSSAGGKLRKIDLGVPPPRYSQSNNLSNSVYSLNEKIGTMVESVDHNMNNKAGIRTYSEEMDLPSIVSMEILEAQRNNDYPLKNEDIIKRVEEMNQIVLDAENYLAEESGKSRANNDDDDSLSISDHPRLKAADSLLLLTQISDSVPIQKVQDGNETINDISPCDSDTDSFGTPNNSPSHRREDGSKKATSNAANDRALSMNQCSLSVQMPNMTAIKTAKSCSSFGLHSPDIIPQMNLSEAENQLIETLNQLKDSDELNLPFDDGTLCIDPDIIDLTVIPPPTSPQIDISIDFSSSSHSLQMGEPPTPYRENFNLVHQFEKVNSELVTELDNICDSFPFLRTSEDILRDVETLQHLPSNIDDFIASVAIPPPPPLSETATNLEESNNDDYLDSLIIPPPPIASPNFNHTQDEIITRFWKATDDMKKMCGFNSKPEPSSSPNMREVHSSSSGDSGYESIVTSSFPSYTTKLPNSDHNSLSIFRDCSQFCTNPESHLKCVSFQPLKPRSLSESSSCDDLCFGKDTISSLSNFTFNAERSSNLSRSHSWTALQGTKPNCSPTGKPPLAPKPPLPSNSFSRYDRKRISTLKSQTLKHPKGARFISKMQSKNGNVIDHLSVNGYFDPIPPPTQNFFLTDAERNAIFIQAQRDIDVLLSRIDDIHENCLRTPTLFKSADKEKYTTMKDALILNARQFVTASKLFVKCATESSSEVINHLLECITLLATIYAIGEHIMLETECETQLSLLVERLKEVAVTYACTVDTVHKLNDAANSTSPYMALLMNHATSLANALSALMRTLRALDS